MANVKHFRTRRTSHPVSKSHATGKRRPWTAEELSDIRQFLDDHEHLSWKMKAKLWRQKHGIKRTGESLRGKQNYLHRLANDIDYQRPLSRSETVHSSESSEGSDLTSLANEPTFTAEQTEISKCRQARQIPLRHPSNYGLADRGRPTLPSMASINHFTTSASALREDLEAGFDSEASFSVFRPSLLLMFFAELLDSVIARWSDDHGYDGRKHLKD